MITVSTNLSKMGKIALGVHKMSLNTAVRAELGMFPLTTDIYARIAIFFHLLELAGKSNTVIQSGIAECITLVNNNQTCWLTSVLYLFKIIEINLNQETGQLNMFEKNDIITAVKNTLRKRFEDNFSK